MAHLPPLASLEALEARIADGVSGQEARAEAVLDDASALVRHVAATTWVDDDGELSDDIPDIVVTVTLAVARRAFLNPEGYAQKQVDDVSVTYARDAASGNGVFLTDSERAQILAASGTARTGLWTLRTTRGDDYDDQYLEVVGQDEPMPFLPADA